MTGLRRLTPRPLPRERQKTMNVAGDYTFEGPQDLVWETLLDPEVLAAVLPGCEKLELVGEDEYEGDLKIKVGPVQGNFSAKVNLVDIQHPDAYTMKVDGRGAPGFVKATGHMRLAAAGEQTTLSYDGQAQVGGKLASVGQRLIESSAKAIIKQTMDGLNNAVVARVSAKESGEEAPPPPAAMAPSQTEFAAAVAKEVAKDLMPGWARTAGIALVIAIVVYVLYILVN
jgi:carbon monoxide dehydrogenase subunit G